MSKTKEVVGNMLFWHAMEKWKAKYAGLGQHIIGNNDHMHLIQGTLILIHKILKCLAAWTGDDMAQLGTQPFAYLLAPVLNDQGTQSYNKHRPSWMCCQGCKNHDCTHNKQHAYMHACTQAHAPDQKGYLGR